MERKTNSTFIFWLSVFCVGLCFGMHYFVSVIVLQSSLRGRENWLLCFNCLSYVLFLLIFCGSSSRCHGLVCSVWLWYFLVIFTYFFKVVTIIAYVVSITKKSRNTDMTLAVSNILKIWFTVRNTNSSFIFIRMIFIFSTMVSYGVF